MKMVIGSFMCAIVSMGVQFQKHSSMAFNCLIKGGRRWWVGVGGGRESTTDSLSAGELSNIVDDGYYCFCFY